MGIDDGLDSLSGGVAGVVAFAANEIAIDFPFGEVFNAAGSDTFGSSSSSMMMGMGLLLVCHWCTCLVDLITLGAVVSFEVGTEI